MPSMIIATQLLFANSQTQLPNDSYSSGFSTTQATNKDTECVGRMYDLLDAVCTPYRYAHGYIGLTVAAVGVAANAANIGVLTRPHMHSCTNLLLTALAIADLLTVASFLPIYPHFYIWRTSDAELFPTPYFLAVCYVLFQGCFVIMLHFAAVWITIAVAFFRWVCVCWPLSGNRFCSFRNARLAIAIIVVAALLTNIPNALCNKVADPKPDQKTNRTIYNVESSDLCNGNFMSDVNHWMLAFDIRFIPSVALTALTLLLLNEMRKVNARFLKLRLNKTSACSCESNVSASFGPAAGPGSSRGSVKRLIERETSVQQPMIVINDSSGGGAGHHPIPDSSYENAETSPLQNESNGSQNPTSLLSPEFTPSKRTSKFGLRFGSIAGGGTDVNSKRGSVARNVRFVNGAGGSPRTNNVEESRRLRESNRTTQMLLWVVAMFLLVEFPQGVLHVVNSVSPTFEICAYQKLGDLLDLETLVMNTVKIVLYASMSRQFRDTFMSLLSRLCVALHIGPLHSAATKRENTDYSGLVSAASRATASGATQQVST